MINKTYKKDIETHKPLSVVIIAKNEAKRIEDCLKSVIWADEIVVVDSGSDDETIAIAKKYTDKVFSIPWRGFGLQKQAAVELASHDIVLNIDCDERVTSELAQEIKGILSSGKISDAYTLPRRTFVGNKEIRHCGWYPDRTIRLFNRNKARYSDSLVHEVVEVDTKPMACKGHLLHYSFDGLKDMLNKLNQYTDLSAKQMYEAGKRGSLLDIIFRPFSAFLKTYFIKLGFLDGLAGFNISIVTAFSTFTKYVKLVESDVKS